MSSSINHLRVGQAWTAYVSSLMLALFIGLSGLALATSGTHALGGLGVIALAALFMTYRVLLIRSWVLFTDEAGVWLHGGILPWSRGTRGVKWRDLEGATVFTGFKSWLLRSSTVRVSHRFTKDSEIIVAHVPHGAHVVGHINEIHHVLLANPSGHLGIDASR